ncbi:MAG: phage tail protein [Bryobacteraceae bacterium]
MNPFLGSIMVVSFNYAPKGWSACNGQTMPINQYQALFSLLGTTFGGNGVSTFQLPNLQGRAAMGFGSAYALGAVGGEAAHTLIPNEMPTHTHLWQATSAGPSTADPTNGVLAGAGLYTKSGNTTMSPAQLSPAGGSQPHENSSPYLVLNFCIALQGIFPSRN